MTLPSNIRLFVPTPSKAEAKNDATTTLAKQIIDVELRARQEKTERLRAERLAMNQRQLEAQPKTRRVPGSQKPGDRQSGRAH